MRRLLPYILFAAVFLVGIQLVLNEIIKEPSENAVTVSSLKQEGDQFPSLEMFLVSQDEESGEIIETYREYEVIYDENGDIKSKEPTDHYEYIRYKK